MVRFTLLVVLLAAFNVFGMSCDSPDKSNYAEKTYRLKCGDLIPAETARRLESKVLREGRNEIDSFATGKLYAIVTNGKLDSLVLEEDGQEPLVQTMALVTGPAPDLPGEFPQSCEQKYKNCLASCPSARDPECCLYKCYFKMKECEVGVPTGGAGRGITIF